MARLANKEAASTKPAKKGISPERLKIISEANVKIFSAAKQMSGECLSPHIIISKPGSCEGYYGFETNGVVVSVSKDAPEAALNAAEFLMAEVSLENAIKEGDGLAIRELAFFLGVSAVDTMLETGSGVRMHYLVTKHTTGKLNSRKGGKHSPIWEPVKDLAHELFKRFKRGKGISDNAAINRTRAELIRLHRDHEFLGKIPSKTCLHDHLVAKPASRK